MVKRQTLNLNKIFEEITKPFSIDLPLNKIQDKLDNAEKNHQHDEKEDEVPLKNFEDIEKSIKDFNSILN